MKKSISKKYISVVICMYLLLILAACQKQSVWQEQYDLGMRYLNESNYEEAILAFMSAIEIDPRQADAYVYLTQAYLTTGDTENAEAIRAQGYEATGDGRLKMSVTHGIVYIDDIPFDQRITYRESDLLSTEQKDSVRQSIELLKAEQTDMLREMLMESGLPFYLCTQIDGYKVDICILRTADDYYRYHLQDEDGVQSWVSMEIRPENGQGYFYYCRNAPDGYVDGVGGTPSLYESYQTGDCQNWQYNGKWRGLVHNIAGNDGETYYEGNGTVADNKVSVYTLTDRSINYTTESVHETIRRYENGKMVSAYLYRDNMTFDVIENYHDPFFMTLDRMRDLFSGFIPYMNGTWLRHW